MQKPVYVLLVCSGGNSTSILVAQMEKHLREDECWHIDAIGYSELPMVIGRYDYILVAPQMSFQLNEIQKLADQFDEISVIQLPADLYAKCDGEQLDDYIRTLMMHEDPSTSGGKRMSEVKKKESALERFSDWMMQYLVPVASKIGNQRHLAAVRDGLTILIPATIVGGFSILLAIPPVPASITEPSNFFYAFLLAWKAWAANNYSLLITPYMLTIGIISIYVVCGVSYRLATNYKMNGINNMIASLLVFLIVSGALDIENGTLNDARLGAGYMFGAMIIALLTVEITRAFDKHNIKIKLPDSVPPNVAAPFNVLIALVFNVVLFSIINAVLVHFTGGGITDLIYTIFQPLMRASGTLPSILILSLLTSLFWFFGIHGDNMMSAITTPITTAAIAANAEAVAAGTAVTQLPYIYAGSMTAVFGGWILGNCGMNLWLLLFAKSERTRSLAKVAAVPAFFNIAEPYVFGLPEVLNLYYFIPSVICQILNICVYYALASAHIVGRFYITMPFTVPAPLQAFLATGGNVPALILILVLMVVDMVIFTPFMKIFDRQQIEEEKRMKAEQATKE